VDRFRRGVYHVATNGRAQADPTPGGHDALLFRSAPILLNRRRTERNEFSGAGGDSRSRLLRKERSADRRNVFGPAADTRAEIADPNRSGVSGAITRFVTRQQSLWDLRVSPLPPRLLTLEAINGLGRTIHRDFTRSFPTPSNSGVGRRRCQSAQGQRAHRTCHHPRKAKGSFRICLI
jgi:hypothetical protein